MSSTAAQPTVSRMRSNSRAGSTMRGSSNTRATIGGGAAAASGPAVSPRRSTATPGKLPAATSRLGTTVRDKTPGPASGVQVAKATPMEIRKMENTIKDKEAEITRMTAQIKQLQSDKTNLTKEKAEKEALAVKASKEKAESVAKA